MSQDECDRTVIPAGRRIWANPLRDAIYGSLRKELNIMYEKRMQAKEGVERQLELIGEDPNRPGLQDTPERVIRALQEMTRGYDMEPEEILKLFDEGLSAPVVLTGIRFTSLCEHHMLPFVGEATVAYLPHQGKVVGVSKLARLVECFALRLQVQERLTTQIAEAMVKHVTPDVAVIVSAHHSCMGCRGAKQPDAKMTSSVMLGRYRTEPALRAELFSIINGK